MKVTKLVFAVLLSLVAIPALCAPQQKPTLKTVKVKEADAGKTKALAVGDCLVVSLASNPSTGYAWKVVVQGKALKRVGKQTFDSNGSMPGSGGTDNFFYVAVKTGDTKLVFTYARPWEKKVRPAKTLTFKVKVVKPVSR